MKLELYYYPQCPFCARIIKKIDGMGLTKQIKLMNTMQDPENAQRHQAVTGRATVPCLYIDDKPMFESGDIAKWLEANSDEIKK